MNFQDSPEEARFRAEARQWLDDNAPHHLEEELKGAPFGDLKLKSADVVAASKAWQRRKRDAGWSCLHWSKEYGGRSASPIERIIWQQEEGVYSRLSRLFGIGLGMCGPTLMAWATEQQKRRYLPPMASGDEVWCQLFSEPAAGSDLAGLRTRAERQGDHWVVNGQKVWTSRAHVADFAILLTRTDPSVPKHAGLTMFFIDMRSPGVEFRPIKQINGGSGFSEVFFDEVRVPDEQRLGAPGQGWTVSLTTLMNERLSIGAGMSTGLPELIQFCMSYRIGSGMATDDRSVRSKLATWAVRESGLRHTAARSMSALSKGIAPGPENSIGKLVAGATMQDIATFAIDLQAQHGLLDGSEALDTGRFQAMLLRSAGTRIEGGTDEILRNVIAERVLGLPQEFRADKGIPFNNISSGKRDDHA
ncbi:acyl-CoA dehydrogenase family protein [Paraburkholderia elongata]|uniref:Acyl-CoA dehydrogenase n=1 Tax=Paraburkholderia elongata TaxID=2675747 RepID=A0A972NLM4_9BURK|nr:acyl-CoA dehydrogenase family protein [Paraburkholderia elongata]NPT54849.1 acyl-CoA dehydrogenase [Paraburkholderia elongata]